MAPIIDPELYDKLDSYNVTGKSAAVFRKQLQALSKPLLIENFLTQDEVRYLIAAEAAKPDSAREWRPPDNAIRVTHAPWDEAERSLLKTRLEDLIGKFDVWGGNYFTTTFPYFPHVDMGFDRPFANYKNVVIPLSLDPENSPTYLALFKQRYFGNNTCFFRSGAGPGAELTTIGSLFDYSNILFLDDKYEFDPEILENQFGHINPQDLRGLSIDQIVPWKVGTCIIFDSAQIHCSVDFRKTGIYKKQALSIFTGLVE